MESEPISLEKVTTYVSSIVWALKRTSQLLKHTAEFLEEGHSLSKQCVVHAVAISTNVTDAYESLSDTGQNAVFIVMSFVALLSFAFGMPTLIRFFFGSDPYLEPFPFPSKTYDHLEDEQSESFIDADVEPQLLQEASNLALSCIEPHTEELLGYAPQDTPDSVRAKVALARKAQTAWAQTSFEERRRVLRVLRNYIIENQTKLCGISRKDTGKTMLDASLGEVLTTLEKLRWLLSEGESVLRPSRRSVGPMCIHKVAEVVYEPLGVIGAIAPWNYPVHNFFNPVLASLFSGNAVIVKPSEYTAYSSLYVARLTRRALALCNQGPELVQLAVGGAEVGAAMVEADIDKLFFTGSTKVGRMVARAAADRLLPVVLELGGKDPFIVCDDANIPHAVSLCMRGVFQNAGQNCIGVERVYVQNSVKDKFVEAALAVVQELRLGVDVGAMTMGEKAIDDALHLVKEAEKDGAKLLCGGKRGSVDGKGYYLEPSVLVGVRPEMRIAQEEVFAPVMTIFSWASDKELLSMVNKCRFGLGSSVFSGNKKRGQTIVKGLKVGMSNVNDFSINYMCQSMPFGGVKESGIDRFAGIEGLRGCCLAKSTTRDRFPFVKTKLPRNFMYPVTKNAFSMSAEINKIAYIPGMLAKWDALRNILISACTKEWMPRETQMEYAEYEKR